MDPFLRTCVARVADLALSFSLSFSLACIVQKPTRVNTAVDSKRVQRNRGRKTVAALYRRAKWSDSKERQIKHETDNRAI